MSIEQILRRAHGMEIKAKEHRIRELEAEVERLRAWLGEWLQYEADTSECPDCKGCADDEGDCLYTAAVKLLGESTAPPELWPCGHEKARHDEGCQECSP